MYYDQKPLSRLKFTRACNKYPGGSEAPCRRRKSKIIFSFSAHLCNNKMRLSLPRTLSVQAGINILFRRITTILSITAALWIYSIAQFASQWIAGDYRLVASRHRWLW